MAPEEESAGLSAIEQPLLVIVGAEDEVFFADRFPPLVQQHSKGEIHLIPDANHNSVHYHPSTIAHIDAWLNQHFPP